MQLRGISPLITPDVLAGLAHLQEGHLVAVVGEGFPRLPRRLWGQSPWPMSGPREVALEGSGVRDVLEGLLDHVPVDAFYWSTDHDRELPGYLSQVRWQVTSWSDCKDAGVPSDQLLEMARTAELLLRTSEVRCNSPIVLRVGGLPGLPSPQPSRRRGGDAASTDAAVQTTPRLARAAKLSIAAANDLTPPTSPTPATRAASARVRPGLPSSNASTETPPEPTSAPTNLPVPRPRAALTTRHEQLSATASSPKTSEAAVGTPTSTFTAPPAFSAALTSAPESSPPHAPSPPSSPEDWCHIVLRKGDQCAPVAVFARREAPVWPPPPPLRPPQSLSPSLPPPVVDAQFQDVSVANAVQCLEAVSAAPPLPPARQPAPAVKSAGKAAVNGRRRPVLRKQVSFSDLVQEIPHQADQVDSGSPDVVLLDASREGSAHRCPDVLLGNGHDAPNSPKTGPSTEGDHNAEARHSPKADVRPLLKHSSDSDHSPKIDHGPETDRTPGTNLTLKVEFERSPDADQKVEPKPSPQSQVRLPVGVNKPQSGEKPDLARRLSLRGRIIPDILPVNMMRAHPKLKKGTDVSKAPYRSVPLCLPSPASANE